MDTSGAGTGGVSDRAVSFSLAPFPGIAALSEDWRELEQRSDCVFFLSWKWIGAWLELSGVRPVLLQGFDDGRLVCLGLLCMQANRRHGVLHSRGLFLNESGMVRHDIIAIEHNGFLLDRRFGDETIGAAMSYLMDLEDGHPLLGTWDEIRFGGVPASYESIALSRGLRRHTVNRRSTAVVDLDAIRDSGGAYLDSLSSNTRYQIRRSTRLYEARGPLRLERARDGAEALEYLEGLKRFHQPYWEARTGQGAFSYPFLVAFHQRLVTECEAGRDYELARISCGDQDIGYVYNLIRGRWIGFYLGGFRYESDNKMKPGMVCFALCLQAHLDQGMSAFDFLAGDQRYKSNLAELQPGLVWFDIQRPRLKLRLEDLARDARNGLQRLRERRATVENTR